jgi:polyhydroxybutyrate depolymerase
MEGATIHAEMSKMGQLGAKEGFAVAIPDGWGTPIHWEVGTDEATNYDLKFVDQMLDKIEADYCIDTARVYATGLSNGAFMTSLMACVRADRFAAFAPVAGLTVPEPCAPDRATPVMGFHGTNDQILKYNGGIGGIPGVSENTPDPMSTEVPDVDLNGEGYPANLAAWAKRNGCESTPSDTTESTGETTTPEVVHRVYDCPENADVEFYSIIGGGHTWPGSEFSKAAASVMGPTTMSFNASERIWEFFQRHALTST